MDFIYTGEFPPRWREGGELLAVLPIIEFAAKHTEGTNEIYRDKQDTRDESKKIT